MATRQDNDLSILDDSPLDIKLADFFIAPNQTDFDNMDSLINHSNWYEKQCINHYDEPHTNYFNTMLNLSTTGTPPATPVSKTLQSPQTISQLNNAMIIPSDPIQTEGIGSNENYTNTMNMKMKYTPYDLPSSSNYIPQKSHANYNQGRMQLVNGDCITPNDNKSSAVMSLHKSPAALSPPRSVSSTDSDDLNDALDILISSFRTSDSSPLDVLLSFLSNRHGIELVAKANDIPFNDLYNFIERYQTRSNQENKRYSESGHSDGKNHESKSDYTSSSNSQNHSESTLARIRKSRGSYSRSKCIEVVEFVRKGGHSARAAAKKFGIPKSTVHNWLHEDIASRPERGHRKRVKPDFSPCPSPRNHEASGSDRHEADTAYQSHDVFNVMSPRNNDFNISTSPTNPFSVKRENSCNIAMDANFDELKEDWVQQENWYAEQYLRHYSGGSPLETPQVSLSNLDAPPQFTGTGTIPPAADPVLDATQPYYPMAMNANDVNGLPLAVERQLALELQHLKLCDPQPNPEAILNKISEFTTPYFTPSPEWCHEFLTRHGLASSCRGIIS